MKDLNIAELLAQALETERGGILVYEAGAAACFIERNSLGSRMRHG